MITDDAISRSIHALNIILGYSQEEIAKRLGVSYTTVNAWATGKRLPRARHREGPLRLLETLTSAPRTEEERIRAIVARLHVEYGSPNLNNKKDPLDELFFILLSLKTSHRTYEATYRSFKAEFHPWEKLLRAAPASVEKHIREGGLGSLKARTFIDIAQRLKADFGRVTLAPLKRLPDEQVEGYLTSLPGVGVKTARCVAMYSLKRATLPVDTHTYRVGVRLGVVPTSTTTKKVHDNFDAAVPRDLAYSFHTNAVAHGRAICLDPIPRCEDCPLLTLCPTGQQRLSESQKEARSARAASRRRSSATSGESGGRPTAVDIYAGCGGLSVGLEEGGFRVGYALDWDKHACETHAVNFPDTLVECRDVREVTGERIESVVGGPVDLVAGGPNCQGVSQRGLRNPDDPRNLMLKEFVRLVTELRPRMFLFENVPGLAHRHNFGLLQDIFGLFNAIGYRCAADVLLAADFGVPQLRYRFFMVGTLDPTLELSFPAPTHQPQATGELFGLRPYVTVGDAIGDLPVIQCDHQHDEPLPYAAPAAANSYQEYMREGATTVVNHFCAATELINLDRARCIPEGGNWKDISPELLPDRLFTCRMTDHSTTYARLRRDQPSFTITSLFGNITAGAFTHPTVTRSLSVREGARLQSFRDRFVFRGPRNSQFRQIGTAVPPLLARAVAAHRRALRAGALPRGLAPRITEERLRDPRAWDALPVLTPRFKALFGTGTRWPKGWGPEPKDYRERLDRNYSLRPEFWPAGVQDRRRRVSDADLVGSAAPEEGD